MLAYRLAENNGCTVDELSDRMSADEFAYWAAYNQLSPIGGERIDYLAAMICTVMANLWSKKRHKLKEFMPTWGRKARRGSSPAQILAYFQLLKAEQDRKAAKRNG